MESRVNLAEWLAFDTGHEHQIHSSHSLCWCWDRFTRTVTSGVGRYCLLQSAHDPGPHVSSSLVRMSSSQDLVQSLSPCKGLQDMFGLKSCVL